MKMKYEKPVFVAEGYVFENSFAANCDIHVGENASPDPITINKGDHLCTNQNCSHNAGGHQKAEIKDYPTTLFNDGNNTGTPNCFYDWNGQAVTGGKLGSNVSFGKAFLGPEANSETQHRPAYKDKTFFS